jgi:hypothetical protein
MLWIAAFYARLNGPCIRVRNTGKRKHPELAGAFFI